MAKPKIMKTMPRIQRYYCNTSQLLQVLELALIIRRGLVGKDVDVDCAASFLPVKLALHVEEKFL